MTRTITSVSHPSFLSSFSLLKREKKNGLSEMLLYISVAGLTGVGRLSLHNCFIQILFKIKWFDWFEKEMQSKALFWQKLRKTLFRCLFHVKIELSNN